MFLLINLGCVSNEKGGNINEMLLIAPVTSSVSCKSLKVKNKIADCFEFSEQTH